MWEKYILRKIKLPWNCFNGFKRNVEEVPVVASQVASTPNAVKKEKNLPRDISSRNLNHRVKKIPRDRVITKYHLLCS
jgi:hypothetical protein